MRKLLLVLLASTGYAATGPSPVIRTLTSGVYAGDPAVLKVIGLNLQGVSPKIWVINRYIDAAAKVLSSAPTSAEIQVTMPEFRSSYYAVLMLVSPGGQQSNNNARFLVQMAPPSITGITPEKTKIGIATFEVTGERFRPGMQAYVAVPKKRVAATVALGEASASAKVNTILPSDPAPPYEAALWLVNTTTGLTASKAFTVEALKPSITRLEPAMINAGETVNIVVFGTDFQNDASVLINDRPFKSKTIDLTRIQLESLTFPASASTDRQTAHLTVVNPGGLKDSHDITILTAKKK